MHSVDSSKIIKRQNLIKKSVSKRRANQSFFTAGCGGEFWIATGCGDFAAEISLKVLHIATIKLLYLRKNHNKKRSAAYMIKIMVRRMTMTRRIVFPQMILATKKIADRKYHINDMQNVESDMTILKIQKELSFRMSLTFLSTLVRSVFRWSSSSQSWRFWFWREVTDSIIWLITWFEVSWVDNVSGNVRVVRWVACGVGIMIAKISNMVKTMPIQPMVSKRWSRASSMSVKVILMCMLPCYFTMSCLNTAATKYQNDFVCNLVIVLFISFPFIYKKTMQYLKIRQWMQTETSAQNCVWWRLLPLLLFPASKIGWPYSSTGFRSWTPLAKHGSTTSSTSWGALSTLANNSKFSKQGWPFSRLGMGVMWCSLQKVVHFVFIKVSDLIYNRIEKTKVSIRNPYHVQRHLKKNYGLPENYSFDEKLYS